MLNAIQKARMSMAMKSKNPKMNPGFDSLPKDVQAKIMKKKAKLSMKEPMMAMKKPKISQPTATEYKNASRKEKRKIKRETKKQLKTLKKIDKAYVKSAPKPKMAMKKKAKMGMKKAKASQTAGAIMKRERMMN